ncbi:Pseudouridine synthase [Pseudomonas coronafaciens pv. oryzae]|nr:Pseudouridine synthase [Pseudomonas coronafaciens pv. oryzae]
MARRSSQQGLSLPTLRRSRGSSARATHWSGHVVRCATALTCLIPAMRLDRFLSNLPRFNRKSVRLALASGRVQVDGLTTSDPHHEVREFSCVMFDTEILQPGKAARYFMLHKPPGCVSATTDAQHPTVLDLLDEPDKHELHIAGRLDFNTTGLILITNDGQWSRRLTQPQTKMPKVYYVETEQLIDDRYVLKFAEGLYFSFENITTQPAQLNVLGPRSAHLSIVEGRYHQVKRMFGHFDNKVLRLHRESIGALTLDPTLAAGSYRALHAAEIDLF